MCGLGQVSANQEAEHLPLCGREGSRHPVSSSWCFMNLEKDLPLALKKMERVMAVTTLTSCPGHHAWLELLMGSCVFQEK